MTHGPDGRRAPPPGPGRGPARACRCSSSSSSCSIASPAFLTPTNLENLLVQSSIVAIPSLAMMMCLVMGEFDLSVGSVVAFAGAITCTLILSGVPDVCWRWAPASPRALASACSTASS